MSRTAPSVSSAQLLELARRHGADAMSFLAFESNMRQWSESGEASDAIVSFADTGTAWVAAGAPLAAAPLIPHIAKAFVQSARENRRRACFFATESCEIEGFSRLLLGEQPVWDPRTWPDVLAAHRRLREQIRRPKAKGVAVRRVEPCELEPSGSLRQQIDALAIEWLKSRRMTPMGFLVTVEPFHVPEEHRYFVAEQGGRVVAFLSAVPVYARRGWLVQDVLRGQRAPNGTTEALIDALMRDVAETEFVTLGLAPLSGPIAPWLRLARLVSTPLFDFTGLRAFRQRLRPSRWESVWLMYPRSEWAATHLIDSLRAFASGSLRRFAVRSIGRRPSGPPWALALPLAPWTLLLAVLVLSGRAGVVGFSTTALAGWVVFDALLGVQLLRSALRPRRGRLLLSASAAMIDAGVSVPHFLMNGVGTTIAPVVLRSLAALAPCVGATVLIWVVMPQLDEAAARELCPPWVARAFSPRGADDQKRGTLAPKHRRPLGRRLVDRKGSGQ